MSAEVFPELDWEGDRWRLLNTGVYRDGMVYCHLASTTRNHGIHPVQAADMIDAAKIEEISDLPRGYFNWNRSLRGAFDRGRRDQQAGKSVEQCPYQDTRKSNGRLTWSRAYRTAWRDGHQWSQQHDNMQQGVLHDA